MGVSSIPRQTGFGQTHQEILTVTDTKIERGNNRESDRDRQKYYSIKIAGVCLLQDSTVPRGEE